MLPYILNRLAMLIIGAIGVTSVVFFVTRVLPGDPAAWAAGIQAEKAQIERLRRDMLLDRPLWEQYAQYIRGLMQGDLGSSMYTRRQVSHDVRDFFPATVELALYGMLLTTITSVPLGVVAALHRGRLFDTLIRVLSTIGAALPIFWLGLMMQFVLYGVLNWLPPGGRLSQGLPMPHRVTGLISVDAALSGQWEVLGNALVHLLLPCTALALQRMSVISRMVRASMLDVLTQDYVRTARAKGLAERRVVYKHGLKNSFLPVLTMLGLQLGWLLGGTVLVEIIFQWPGLGQYAARAIMFLDYSPVAAVVLLVSISFLLVNLIVDLMYAMLDPRIRY